jgi:diguanylate cyclase (GGDEF)-like protein
MALVVAERVRQNIESQPFNLEHNEIYITVSIGVAIVVQEHADKDALLHDADEALYRAKEGGRNRVEPGTYTSKCII